MNTLRGYGSDSEGSDDAEDSPGATLAQNVHLKPGPSSALAKKMLALAPAAPDVQPNEEMDPRRHLDPTTKEIKYNPKYEELYAPVVGPNNPFQTEQEAAVKNTLTG